MRSAFRVVGVAGLMAVQLAGMPGHGQGGCPSIQFEGEVTAGQSFRHALGTSQAFLLEAVPSGWIVRVVPVPGARPAHDAAELATPPYRSPNPLLLTTDFSFRAQDAIAWNPREFHFFTQPAQMRTAEAAFQATMKEPNRPAAGAALYAVLPQACTASLQILDARIAGGSADQTLAASTIATHFAQTAHTVDTNAPPSPLGRLLLLRFRVRVEHDAAVRRHR